MLDLLAAKIGAIPGYFWSLALAWGLIEAAGWLRMRNSRKNRLTRRRGGSEPHRRWSDFIRLGLRRRVF